MTDDTKESIVKESEVWLALAECLRELHPDGGHGGYHFYVGSWPCAGLCTSILSFSLQNDVSIETRNRMEMKVPRAQSGEFVWPLTVIGHQQRREFCLEQAELCAERGL